MTPTPKRPTIQRPKTMPVVRPEKPSDPTPNPCESVDYSQGMEKAAPDEFAAMQEAYRQRAKNEAKRHYAATDSEHWFAVCFRTRKEKEAFLKAIGLTGRNAPTKYIRGDLLAAALGVDY